MSKTIGIDLGTNHSCMAVFSGDQSVIIPTSEGSLYTPSWVAFLPDGERLIGEAAKLQAAQNPKNTIFSVKRLLGKKFAELEEELAASKLLTAQLREKNEQEKKQRELIEKRLSTALNNLNSIEGGLANPNSLEDKSLVAELQTLLREKDGMIENLEGKLTFAVEEITNKEAELELAKAMQETGDLSGAKPDREVVNALQGEMMT